MESVIVREANLRILERFAKLHAIASFQRMSLRNNENMMILVEHKLLKVLNLKIPYADAEICSTGLHVINDFTREPLVHPELDLHRTNVTDQIIGNAIGNQIATVGVSGDRDDSTAFIGKSPKIRLGIFRGPQNRLCVSCENFTGGCQFQPLCAADEKFGIKCLLQLLNALRGTGVGHVHPFGTFYQASLLSRRQKECKIRKIIVETRFHL